jgi:hypothetical protein
MWLILFLLSARRGLHGALKLTLLLGPKMSFQDGSYWRLSLRTLTCPRTVQTIHRLTVKSKDPMKLEVNSRSVPGPSAGLNAGDQQEKMKVVAML